MKSKQIILLFFAIMAFTECSTDNNISHIDAEQSMIFNARLEDNSETKTVLQSDGSILWSPSDAINLFYGSSVSGKFTSTNTENASAVEFAGTLKNYKNNGKDSFWAVYPYSKDVSCDGESITLTLPYEQIATGGTFSDNLFISIAKSNDTNLNFYNLCGGIKFQVPQQGIKSVTLRGSNNEILAGTIKVKMDVDGKPYVEEITNGVDSLVLIAPNKGTFNVDEYYYMVALPTSLESGYTLTFNKSAISASVTSESYVQIKRSKWGEISKEFVSNITFKNCVVFYCSSFGSSVRIYSDAEHTSYERISLSKGYNVIDDVKYGFSIGPRSNGDFIKEIDLTNWDASLVTNASYMFSKTSISTPPDISGLTNVTNASHMFYDCEWIVAPPDLSSLTKIKDASYMFACCSRMKTPPDLTGLTNIIDASYMFDTCLRMETPPDLSDLSKVTNVSHMFRACDRIKTSPDISNLTKVTNASYMFESCDSLARVIGIEGLTNVTDVSYMFYNCYNLVVTPDISNLTNITNSEWMFYGCISLMTPPDMSRLKITNTDYMFLESGITSVPKMSKMNIGRCMFSGCKGLAQKQKIYCKSVGSRAFEDCENIEEVEFMKGVKSVADSAFNECSSIKCYTYPTTIKSVGKSRHNASNLTTIYCKAEEPPTLSRGAFDDHTDEFVIYVPKSKSRKYQTSGNWSRYWSYIKQKEF